MNLGKLTVSTAPTVEPVSREEVKNYLRVDISADDSLLDRITKAAREFLEGWAGLTFINTTYEERFDGFPRNSRSPLALQRPPLQSVTSITYLDTSGDSQTWASSNYQVDIYSKPGVVLPNEGQVYPTTQSATLNTVTATFLAGEGAAGSDVDAKHRQALLWLCEHMYEQRDIEIAGATVSKLSFMWKNLITAPVVAFG